MKKVALMLLRTYVKLLLEDEELMYKELDKVLENVNKEDARKIVGFISNVVELYKDLEAMS